MCFNSDPRVQHAPSQPPVDGHTGPTGDATLSRADEVEDLIDAVKSLIIPYIRSADASAAERATGGRAPAPSDPASQSAGTVLVDPHEPEALVRKLRFSLPERDGRGRDGLLETIGGVLRYSVNTWDQGFLDKLYSSTNAVGVISELLLAVLNTNLHIYSVSPSLTIIEKTTAKQLAALFGFNGPRAGGIVCQGGSASNMTSIVVARNTLYPSSKSAGNAGHHFVLFTSQHGHYSVEKAAITCGMGSANVVPIPVDGAGRMDPSALRAAISRAKSEGKTPLYVNATAGTTVLGSYDPFAEISAVCKEHGLWMHVDASWGGAVAFSARLRCKLAGAELADSLTVNPHKMLNVPVTCSFLLTPDTAVLHRANTLPAGYLFHAGVAGGEGAGASEPWDLADLTLQCGRRGDGLKLALAWVYYGAAGFGAQVDRAFDTAAYLATLVQESPDFDLLSSNPPPCLQVCFYYAPGRELTDDKEENTRRTKEMVAKLVPRGFMVDYAPGEKGSFFRVVVNCQTLKSTVDGLVKALSDVGREVMEE
ncbi:hypothetical protein DL765_001978 [Monosporascus sp. GIB2]|nr:hypothetical protein DL765_001978 [Monosporascus sp. GIB2]